MKYVCRVRVVTHNCSGRQPLGSKCYSHSLVFLQPFFLVCVIMASPFSHLVWEPGSPFHCCCWFDAFSNPVWTSFFCLVWFRQFPCESLPWSNIVISHHGPGFSGYCLSALSGPATHIAQLHPHNQPPPPSPASCGKFDCDPWRSTLTNGRGSSMSAPSNNLIKAGRSIHEETKCWLRRLQLRHQLAF